MHEIRTQIDIASTPEHLWSILTDLSAYSEWNPFIRSAEGLLQPGEKLSLSIQPTGSRGMTLRPTVLVVRSNVELRWLGRLLCPGIFDGGHYFQIVPAAAGHTRFIQGERFSGLLVSFAKRTLDRGNRAGFIAMNQALKERAE
jgi:hypothetical protein